MSPLGMPQTNMELKENSMYQDQSLQMYDMKLSMHKKACIWDTLFYVESNSVKTNSFFECTFQTIAYLVVIADLGLNSTQLGFLGM